ncbi:MAG TPA: RNA polymerase sigma factor [Pirellulales bacterium]|nr:RNA polymerase sigma factor [Pirellulales bacterium]
MSKLAARQEVATAVLPARKAPSRLDVRPKPDQAWLAVWNTSEAKLRRLGRALGIDGNRIDDVLQDAYLAAMEAPERDWDDESRRRWLFRVAINRCRLEQRRRRTWQEAWEKLRRAWSEYREANQAEAAAGAEERRALRAALERLPPELRGPLVLRYYCEFDATEIGNILDLPPSTVRGQLRTGRLRLAAMLRQAGFRPPEEEA